MRKRCYFILICISIALIIPTLLIFNSDNALSATAIPESAITGDKTWDIGGSPYYIEGNVTVEGNLIIEAGVEVLFNGNYSIFVDGKLTAIGNALSMIKFTSNATVPKMEDWNRIQINSTGSAEIKYCNITYGRYGIFHAEKAPENSIGNNIENNIMSNNNEGIHLDMSSSDNTILNNTIYDNYNGIYLFISSNNTILNNNIINNSNYGLYVGRSEDNDIQNNNISDNQKGLRLYYALNNTILNNNISDNLEYGVSLFYSTHNVMRYNLIYSNSGDGISFFYSSSNNEMTNNNISYNGNYGIRLSQSPKNRIFHNNLIENAIQAFDDRDNNDWDSGYPLGGNYWSDYIGVDEKRGEMQDVPSPDGIGDTPYVIDSDSQDNYPLMNKTRDIAPYLIALISPYNNSIIKKGTIIDLHILVQNIQKVNYSINGTGDFPLDKPWDISTSGWSEGDNRLDVYINDTSGNVNSSWFFFVLDSTKPSIELNFPVNNAIFKAGVIINLSILDPHVKSVYYLKNGGTEQNLSFPYDIDTSLWTDGTNDIEIHAEDVAGNANSTSYRFTVDSTPPAISLNSPANNSYIKPGVPIDLSILDEHLNSVNYSLDDGPEQSFTTPYIIDTSLFGEGGFSITVNAIDDLGNFDSICYEFVIDSISPSVILNSPKNNSVVRGAVPINFSITEVNPFFFSYSLNFGGNENLLPPYNIDTSSWPDMSYTINVNVTDYAGNSNLSWYNITIDSSKPVIDLVSPSSNSFIRAGTVLLFEIFDPNLLFANYSVNSGESQELLSSLKIDTTGWSDGTYNIEVFAGNSAGDIIFLNFTINIDSTPPMVVTTNPRNRDEGIPVNTSIMIQFNEIMDKASLTNATSISPLINFTLTWSHDNLTMIITPDSNLTNATTYTIVINTTAKDLADNPLAENFVLSFTTGPSQKEEGLWLLFLSILAFLIALILLTWLVYTRKKRISEEEEGEEEEDEFDIEGKEKIEEEDIEAGLLEEEAEEEGKFEEEEVEEKKGTEEKEVKGDEAEAEKKIHEEPGAKGEVATVKEEGTEAAEKKIEDEAKASKEEKGKAKKQLKKQKKLKRKSREKK